MSEIRLCKMCPLLEEELSAEQIKNEKFADRIRSLEAQLAASQAALDKYGRHFGECRFGKPSGVGYNTFGCSCGFDKALTPSPTLVAVERADLVKAVNELRAIHEYYIAAVTVPLHISSIVQLMEKMDREAGNALAALAKYLEVK